MDNRRRILVVGAGIGGLGIARALAQRGIGVDVVEREPTWTDAGAGIYLPGNAVRALRALGLESAVTERAARIRRQLICDHRGRLLSDIDLSALWGDVGACVALHRADLHEVLLSSGDGVDVRMGVRVRRLRDDGETVRVDFGDGRALTSFEARREPRCRWVRTQTHRRDRTRGLPPVMRDLVLRRWGRQIFHHNYSPLRKDPSTRSDMRSPT